MIRGTQGGVSQTLTNISALQEQSKLLVGLDSAGTGLKINSGADDAVGLAIANVRQAGIEPLMQLGRRSIRVNSDQLVRWWIKVACEMSGNSNVR